MVNNEEKNSIEQEIEQSELEPTIIKSKNGKSTMSFVTHQEGKGFVIIGAPDIRKETKKKNTKRLPHQYPWIG